MRRQIPLELVFQDISTFDAGISTFDPIVSSLLQELDVGKKDTASDLIKKAPQPPGIGFIIQKRLNKLRNNRNNNNNDDGLSPSSSTPPFNNFQQPLPQPPPLPPSFNNFVPPPLPPPPPSFNNFILPTPPPQPPLPTFDNFTIPPLPQPDKPSSFGSRIIIFFPLGHQRKK